MHNLSMAQALSIWSDLEEARLSERVGSGDTTEIYMYRLMACDPMAERGARKECGQLGADAHAEQIAQACRSLYALLSYFREVHDRIEIEVNEKRLGDWVCTMANSWRVDVRILERVALGGEDSKCEMGGGGA